MSSSPKSFPALLNAELVLCQWEMIGHDMADEQDAFDYDVMPSLQVGHPTDGLSSHDDVTSSKQMTSMCLIMGSIWVLLVAQRRAELAARLVRACGPPAAQELGCSTVNLLLQLAARVAQLQCASTPP
jgi:hypothetical protein